ncbi:MAG TPA: hypothetical protein VKX39_06480 [Bryobacteraceae bacterium]|jgi:hypothetical protein|nr:hypothetical protein [Bryobacteraceae bacterium]
MIVYRDHHRTVPTRELLAGIVRKIALSDHDSIREGLIEFGQLECGIADALLPDDERLADLRRIALRLGRLFYRSFKRRPSRAREEQAQFNRLSYVKIPETIELRTPEGYAFYGLYPESYIAATETFFSEVHCADAVVIGIRSIGTSLSAVIAGTLAEAGVNVECYTVRPHGHPFDRACDLPPIRTGAAAYLVGDEGPGLSGSSFASVARALADVGVPDSNIFLFPSWAPDPDQFVSDTARDRWRRHRAFPPPSDPQVAGCGFEGWHDLSAATWRKVLFCTESEYPAIQPQHERRKFLSRTAPRIFAKFAGFGARGRAAFERLQCLHDAGFVPAPLDLAHGFLFSRFAPGAPVSRSSPDLICVMLRYLAHIAREFPASADPHDLIHMTSTNVSEALGCAWTPERDLTEPLGGARACLLDARMLPHEWIETARGFLKTDAADHADDHFFPGPRDIAWDLAAIAVEFSLPDSAELLDRFVSLTGDRDVHARFPFYLLAYSAFRFGYCELAKSSVDAAEQRRFARAARRYRALIDQCLRRYTRARARANRVQVFGG